MLTDFHWDEAKKNVLEKKKKKSKWPTQKKPRDFQLSQFSIFFAKISGICPWVRRIN